MICIVSFYEVVGDVSGVGCVRPVIQTLTIHLLIHYCISSATYLTTNYIVNNKQQKLRNIRNNWKSSEINKNIFILIAISMLFLC